MKVGETSAIKKIFDFLNQQSQVVKGIAEREKRKSENAIGTDTTFDDLRKEVLSLYKETEVK